MRTALLVLTILFCMPSFAGRKVMVFPSVGGQGCGAVSLLGFEEFITLINLSDRRQTVTLRLIKHDLQVGWAPLTKPNVSFGGNTLKFGVPPKGASTAEVTLGTKDDDKTQTVRFAFYCRLISDTDVKCSSDFEVAGGTAGFDEKLLANGSVGGGAQIEISVAEDQGAVTASAYNNYLGDSVLIKCSKSFLVPIAGGRPF